MYVSMNAIKRWRGLPFWRDFILKYLASSVPRLSPACFFPYTVLTFRHTAQIVHIRIMFRVGKQI